MATEIESKVRIDDVEAVERALDALRAVYLGAWLQADGFFDHPDRRLLEQDTALRLRISQPLDQVAVAAGAPALLTYKGPRMKGRMKVREEHQVEVPDPSALREILRGLDYTEAFRFEKRRRRWRLQDAEVTIDEVPLLGTFVEVEASAEERVDQVLDALGLAACQRIKESYVDMLAERLGRRFSGEHVAFGEEPSTRRD